MLLLLVLYTLDSILPAIDKAFLRIVALHDGIHKVVARHLDSVEQLLSILAVDGRKGLVADQTIDRYSQQLLHLADGCSRATCPSPIDHDISHGLILDLVGLPRLPVAGSEDVEPLIIGDAL